MSTKKTIQINPELFKISGNKTRKNKEKKALPIIPMVSPNSIKNKLLKRIKEHKTNEIRNAGSTDINVDTTNGNDEFDGAMSFLSDLSKQKKSNEAKQRIHHLKTLKNYENANPIQPSQISLDASSLKNESYKLTDDVPYGCLKGGKKHTYREWKELTKTTDIPDMIRPPTPPKKKDDINDDNVSSREDRLQQIKAKLKKLQDDETREKQEKMEQFEAMEKKLVPTNHLLGEIDTDADTDNNGDNDIEQLIKEREAKIESEKEKRFLKKTIKRKFTLGKSDKLRQVSVLIKDKQTRKNIINTQKELKKTNINDVRKYLRQHGMIKVGSTCPADILRKTFESAMLTGEIHNTNKETLLHNFLSETK